MHCIHCSRRWIPLATIYSQWQLNIRILNSLNQQTQSGVVRNYEHLDLGENQHAGIDKKSVDLTKRLNEALERLGDQGNELAKSVLENQERAKYIGTMQQQITSSESKLRTLEYEKQRLQTDLIAAETRAANVPSTDPHILQKYEDNRQEMQKKIIELDVKSKVVENDLRIAQANINQLTIEKLTLQQQLDRQFDKKNPPTAEEYAVEIVAKGVTSSNEDIDTKMIDVDPVDMAKMEMENKPIMGVPVNQLNDNFENLADFLRPEKRKLDDTNIRIPKAVFKSLILNNEVLETPITNFEGNSDSSLPIYRIVRGEGVSMNTILQGPIEIPEYLEELAGVTIDFVLEPYPGRDSFDVVSRSVKSVTTNTDIPYKAIAVQQVATSIVRDAPPQYLLDIINMLTYSKPDGSQIGLTIGDMYEIVISYLRNLNTYGSMKNTRKVKKQKVTNADGSNDYIGISHYSYAFTTDKDALFASLSALGYLSKRVRDIVFAEDFGGQSGDPYSITINAFDRQLVDQGQEATGKPIDFFVIILKMLMDNAKNSHLSHLTVFKQAKSRTDNHFERYGSYGFVRSGPGIYALSGGRSDYSSNEMDASIVIEGAYSNGYITKDQALRLGLLVDGGIFGGLYDFATTVIEEAIPEVAKMPGEFGDIISSVVEDVQQVKSIGDAATFVGKTLLQTANRAISQTEKGLDIVMDGVLVGIAQSGLFPDVRSIEDIYTMGYDFTVDQLKAIGPVICEYITRPLLKEGVSSVNDGLAPFGSTSDYIAPLTAMVMPNAYEVEHNAKYDWDSLDWTSTDYKGITHDDYITQTDGEPGYLYQQVSQSSANMGPLTRPFAWTGDAYLAKAKKSDVTTAHLDEKVATHPDFPKLGREKLVVAPKKFWTKRYWHDKDSAIPKKFAHSHFVPHIQSYADEDGNTVEVSTIDTIKIFSPFESTTINKVFQDAEKDGFNLGYPYSLADQNVDMIMPLWLGGAYSYRNPEEALPLTIAQFAGERDNAVNVSPYSTVCLVQKGSPFRLNPSQQEIYRRGANGFSLLEKTIQVPSEFDNASSVSFEMEFRKHIMSIPGFDKTMGVPLFSDAGSPAVVVAGSVVSILPKNATQIVGPWAWCLNNGNWLKGQFAYNLDNISFLNTGTAGTDVNKYGFITSCLYDNGGGDEYWGPKGQSRGKEQAWLHTDPVRPLKYHAYKSLKAAYTMMIRIMKSEILSDGTVQLLENLPNHGGSIAPGDSDEFRKFYRSMPSNLYENLFDQKIGTDDVVESGWVDGSGFSEIVTLNNTFPVDSGSKRAWTFRIYCWKNDNIITPDTFVTCDLSLRNIGESPLEEEDNTFKTIPLQALASVPPVIEMDGIDVTSDITTASGNKRIREDEDGVYVNNVRGPLVYTDQAVGGGHWKDGNAGVNNHAEVYSIFEANFDQSGTMATLAFNGLPQAVLPYFGYPEGDKARFSKMPMFFERSYNYMESCHTKELFEVSYRIYGKRIETSGFVCRLIRGYASVFGNSYGLDSYISCSGHICNTVNDSDILISTTGIQSPELQLGEYYGVPFEAYVPKVQIVDDDTSIVLTGAGSGPINTSKLSQVDFLQLNAINTSTAIQHWNNDGVDVYRLNDMIPSDISAGTNHLYCEGLTTDISNSLRQPCGDTTTVFEGYLNVYTDQSTLPYTLGNIAGICDSELTVIHDGTPENSLREILELDVLTQITGGNEYTGNFAVEVWAPIVNVPDITKEFGTNYQYYAHDQETYLNLTVGISASVDSNGLGEHGSLGCTSIDMCNAAPGTKSTMYFGASNNLQWYDHKLYVRTVFKSASDFGADLSAIFPVTQGLVGNTALIPFRVTKINSVPINTKQPLKIRKVR